MPAEPRVYLISSRTDGSAVTSHTSSADSGCSTRRSPVARPGAAGSSSLSSTTAPLDGANPSDDPTGRMAQASRLYGMKVDTEGYAASELKSPQHLPAVLQSSRSCATDGQERGPSSPPWAQSIATAPSSPPDSRSHTSESLADALTRVHGLPHAARSDHGSEAVSPTPAATPPRQSRILALDEHSTPTTPPDTSSAGDIPTPPSTRMPDPCRTPLDFLTPVPRQRPAPGLTGNAGTEPNRLPWNASSPAVGNDTRADLNGLTSRRWSDPDLAPPASATEPEGGKIEGFVTGQDGRSSLVEAHVDDTADAACALCGATDNLLFTVSACYCNNRGSPEELSCFMSQASLGTAGLTQLPSSSRWGPLTIRCPISNESDVLRLVMVEVNTTEVAILAATVALRICPGYSPHPASVDGDRVVAPWLLPCRRTETTVAARVHVTRRVGNTPPPVVPASFPNVLDHLRHFVKLVALVADDEAAAQRLQTKRLTVRWRNGVGESVAGYFEYNTDSRDDLTIGGSVVLTLDGDDPTKSSSHRGSVVWTSGATVGALFDPSFTPDGSACDIRPEAMTVAIDREQTALHMFAFDALSISPHLLTRLLGQRTPSPMRLSIFPVNSFDIPGRDPLTETQTKAVRASLTNPLVTLQGPPGTGKTKTAVAIIWHLVQQRHGPVLVCTGSNPAATHIAAEIAATGISVIRFVAPQSRSRVAVPEQLSVDHFAKPKPELKRLQDALERTGWLPPDQMATYRKLQQDAYLEALSRVAVIACTCSAAGQSLLARLTFKHVLIDEAGQVTEPLTLVAVTKGCQSLVLVGDHKQLPPLVKCAAANRAGLAVSLFERMARAHPNDLHFLDVQHRMHSALSAAPNKAFYDGLIGDADNIDETRRSSIAFPWPTSKPLLFWHHDSPEQRAASTSSFFNAGEASSVVAVVLRLAHCGVAGDAIGVISPYDAQKVHVRMLLAGQDATLAPLVEVDTVDGFQGREKDYMVITTTRSNSFPLERVAIGHVADPRRTCVTLTRARKGTILVGNSVTLSRSPLWSSILEQWRDVTCHGLLDSLQPFTPPETRSAAIGEPVFRKLFVSPQRSAFPGSCSRVCMCGEAECLDNRNVLASHHTLWAKGYLRQRPFSPSQMWALIAPIPLFDENSSPLYGSLECSGCDVVLDTLGDLVEVTDSSANPLTTWTDIPISGPPPGLAPRVYSDSECEGSGWRRDTPLSDTPLMGQIGYNHGDLDAGSPAHVKMLDGLMVAQASVTSALAVELQYMADISWFPAGPTPSGMPRIPSLILALLKRVQWFWRARVVGYMTAAQTLLYWRYANSTRADAASTFAAFVKTCRWKEGAYDRLMELGIWQNRFPEPTRRPVPLLSSRGVLRLGNTGDGRRRTTYAGSFYRQVRLVVCMYGARACLGDMATQSDFDVQERISDIHIEWYELYCDFVQELEPTGCVVTGFANPGSHTWGVVQSGFHAAGLDIAEHLEDFRKWFYDILPRRHPTAPSATIRRGDALVASERAAAVTDHPVADKCIASFDTPCCRSYTSLQLNRPKQMIVGAPGRRNADELASARRENLGECIRKRHVDFETASIPYVVETVLGNGRLPLPPDVTCTVFDGLCFGLRTRDTHRFYHPTACPLFIDSALRDGSTRLAAKTCAGASRVTQPRGPDGVPMGSPCCTGQLCSLYNSGYTIHSRAELCKVIGCDPLHITSKPRLNDALPAKMARLATAQIAGMGNASVRFGVPAISFDNARTDARLGAWLLALLRARKPIRPVQRVMLVIQPPHFPGNVLVCDEDGPPRLPCFDIKRGGFVDAVTAGFHASYPGITVSRLTFVRDMLDADVPTAIFTSGSLADNDAHLLSRGPVGGLVVKSLHEVAADTHFMSRGLEQNLALASWLSLVSTSESAQSVGVQPLPSGLPTSELLSWYSTKQVDRTTLEHAAVTRYNIARCNAQTDLTRVSALRPIATHSGAQIADAEGGKSKAIDGDTLAHDDTTAPLDEIRAWWELGDGLALIDLSPTVWATHISGRPAVAHRLDRLLKSTFNIGLLQLPDPLLSTFRDGKYLVELRNLLKQDTSYTPRVVAKETPHSSLQDEAAWERAAAAADDVASRDPSAVLVSAASPFQNPDDTVQGSVEPPTVLQASQQLAPAFDVAVVTENDSGFELTENDSWTPVHGAHLVHIPDVHATTTALASATDVPFDLEKDFEKKAGNGLKATAESLRAQGPGMPHPVTIAAVGIALQWGSKWVLYAHGPFQPSLFFRYEDALHKDPPKVTGPQAAHVRVVPQRTVDAAISAIEPWFLGLASFPVLNARVKKAVKETPHTMLNWITTARNQDGRLSSRSVPARRIEAKLWVVKLPEDFDWTTPRPGFAPPGGYGNVLIVGTSLNGLSSSSVVSSKGGFDTVEHQALPRLSPIPFSSVAQKSGALIPCALYSFDATDLDRLKRTCSSPTVSALRLLLEPPIAAAAGALPGPKDLIDFGGNDRESSSSSSSDSGLSDNSDSSDTKLSSADDPQIVLYMALRKEIRSLGRQLSLRSEVTSGTPLDLRHRFYLTLFFEGSVWAHIEDKSIESRLLSPLYAEVQKGWLLCCRANGFSNCHWKLVEDGPFEYTSHSACARAHKSSLIPSLSDAEIDSMDDTALEWMFLRMHNSLVTKRAALRWCHETGSARRVVCWKVANLPPNVRLPSPRNHVVASTLPHLHRPPRAHFRRMALTLRLLDDGRFERASFWFQAVARRLFERRARALIQVMQQLWAQACLASVVRRRFFTFRVPQGSARHRLLSRHLSQRDASTERAALRRATALSFLLLGRRLHRQRVVQRHLARVRALEAHHRIRELADYALFHHLQHLQHLSDDGRVAAMFHHLVNRLRRGKRGSIVFAIRSRQATLELYVHERYDNKERSGDTVLFVPAGVEDPLDRGSAEQTAVRELYEETQLKVDSSRLCSSWCGHGSRLGSRWALNDYALLVSESEAESMSIPDSERLKHPSDAWMSLPKILELPSTRCFHDLQRRAQRAFRAVRQDQMRAMARRFATAHVQYLLGLGPLVQRYRIQSRLRAFAQRASKFWSRAAAQPMLSSYGTLKRVVLQNGLHDAHVLAHATAVALTIGCDGGRDKAAALLASTYPHTLPVGSSPPPPGSVSCVPSTSPTECPHVFSLFACRRVLEPCKRTGDSANHRLKWLRKCLSSLGEQLTSRGICSIAFPWRLGCHSGYKQWKAHKAELASFASDNPGIGVYVVQSESDFIRQQQRTQLSEVDRAHKKASRFVKRLSPGPARVLGEALITQLTAQLRDSLGDDTGGSSGGESEIGRVGVGTFGSDSSGEACSTFAAKIRDMAIELSKTDLETIESAAAAVRQENDDKDDIYRRDLLARRAAGELTDEAILEACSSYSRNWVSRTVQQANAREVDVSRTRQRPVRIFGMQNRSDLNNRRGILVKTLGVVDSASAVPDGSFVELAHLPPNLSELEGRHGSVLSSSGDRYTVRLNEEGDVLNVDELPRKCLLPCEACVVRVFDQKDESEWTSETVRVDLRNVVDDQSSHSDAASAASTRPASPVESGADTDSGEHVEANLAADSDAPARVTVSSGAGRFSPARLLGAHMVSGGKRTPCKVRVFDTGSGTCILGYKDAIELERQGLLTRVDPLPSSVRRIRGIGGLDNNVVFWVKCTLDIGGCLVDFLDIPVLRNHSGFLLGNDFIGQGRCQLSYAEAADGDSASVFHGTVVLRDSSFKPISAPVAFATCAEDAPAFLAEPLTSFQATTIGEETSSTDDSTSGCTEPTLNTATTPSAIEDEAVPKQVLRAVNEVAPVAFCPQSTRIAPWCEQILQVMIPASIARDKPVLLTALESPEYGDLGVLVAPALVKADKNGMVPCRVLNVSREPVDVPFLAPVARFTVDPASGVEYEFEVSEIMERCHIGPDDELSRQLVKDMLFSRRSLFRSTLGYCHMARQKIETPDIDSGKVAPPRSPYIPPTPKEEASLLASVQKMLKNRIIEPARSDFNAHAFDVPKSDGTGRTVVNWTRLNLNTKKDTYPLPNIEANLAALGKANWFTTLDLLQGFHQIELDPDSKHKTSFSVSNGQYQFTRMPMGLTSSPGAFMRLVDACLRGLPPGIALAYV